MESAFSDVWRSYSFQWDKCCIDNISAVNKWIFHRPSKRLPPGQYYSGGFSRSEVVLLMIPMDFGNMKETAHTFKGGAASLDV
jgi:hypothetical protein